MAQDHDAHAAPAGGHSSSHDAPGHDDHDDHGQDDHDDHGDHPADDPKWVLVPLVVGLIVAVVLIAVLGLAAGADAYHLVELT